MIGDYDACSLYPSAMSRSYYPAGKPEVMTDEEIAFYNDP